MRTYHFILFVLISLLTGCATAPVEKTITPQPAAPSTSWEQRQQAVSQMTHWDLSGKLAVNTGKDAWSASWHWQQLQRKNYVISIFAPLGSSSVKLTGSAQQVSLETSDGKKATASNAETLLSQQLGWKLPVSNLYYWIRGLPVPGVTAKKHFDSAGQLDVLAQNGWVINYLNYTSANHVDVPSKIFLTYPALKVKIVINQWNLS